MSVLTRLLYDSSVPLKNAVWQSSIACWSWSLTEVLAVLLEHISLKDWICGMTSDIALREFISWAKPSPIIHKTISTTKHFISLIAQILDYSRMRNFSENEIALKLSSIQRSDGFSFQVLICRKSRCARLEWEDENVIARSKRKQECNFFKAKLLMQIATWLR